MDKAAAKQIFRRCGIATPDWVLVEESQGASAVTDMLKGFMPPPPVVVKPVDGGSSMDVTIARDAKTRDAAIADCTDKYGRAMVEKFIKGREFTVSLLARSPCRCWRSSPPASSTTIPQVFRRCRHEVCLRAWPAAQDGKTNAGYGRPGGRVAWLPRYVQGGFPAGRRP